MKVKIRRTEQWEWTATGYGEEATGGSEMSAELHLLRKVVKKFEKELKLLKSLGITNGRNL
jgi:hypothetical protein